MTPGEVPNLIGGDSGAAASGAWLHKLRPADGTLLWYCHQSSVDVSVGDIVLYSKYGGTEVKYNGEEYLVLSARDVLAIVEK